ncbi:hypothetical protein Tco_0273556 [Tanacetum coccineum]
MLPSNTQTNPKSSTSNEKPYRPPPTQNEHVNFVFTRSGKTYNPLANLNTKTAIFLDDSEDEAEEVKKEGEPLPKKPTQTDKPPLKTYKLKFQYPSERLNKEKIEARYAKFLDMIKEVRINVPLVDVLAGMPNYGKFLKDLDELDALLNDSKPFLNTSEKLRETTLDKEFDEFMSGNVQEDVVKDDFEELPPKDELRIRTSYPRIYNQS